MNFDLVKGLETSIAFIDDGFTFTVGDFVLGKSSNGRIFVNGYVSYIDVNNVPCAEIEKIFINMKNGFVELMNQSKIFLDYSIMCLFVNKIDFL